MWIISGIAYNIGETEICCTEISELILKIPKNEKNAIKYLKESIPTLV